MKISKRNLFLAIDSSRKEEVVRSHNEFAELTAEGIDEKHTVSVKTENQWARKPETLVSTKNGIATNPV